MSRQTVAVTDFGTPCLDVEKAVLEPLGCEVIGPAKNGKDQQQLMTLVQDADCVLTQFSPVTADVIGAMRKCKVIVRYGIGVDNVDLKAAAAKRIPVCNVPDYCTDEVADHALAMILDIVRKITVHSNAIKSGLWKMVVPASQVWVFKEITVGLVGFGRIAREVAQRLKPFKCKIIAYDPAIDASAAKDIGVTPASLDDVIRTSDLISLHCPSNDQTKYMINAQSIGKMKDGAILVNTSRGTLVNTNDLVAALQSGKISAAALDVTDPEPINADSPLLKMDNVLINPHMASASPNAGDLLRSSAAGIAALALQGKKLPNIVNGVSA